ncbi:hypothetical protein [Mumia sp. DW29H23]|uniref:hypothetical protein n=1 Tax=Mumia sp. DW29H23 TaxID=3421241 RepID=UPI003D69764E
MATSQDGETTGPRTPADHRGSAADGWKSYGQQLLRNLVLVLAAAVVVVAIGYGLAAFVPRSWAQWIGRRVDGSLPAGTVWGLFLGVVCTFVPLVLVWQAVVRPWIKGFWKVALIVVAVLVALPNLMTLSIVVGTSNGAHAGERILDVDGPGFRAASLWGAIIGALLFVGLVWLTRTNRTRGQRVRDLKSEIDHRDQAERARDESA